MNLRNAAILPVFLMLGHCPQEVPTVVSDCAAYRIIRPSVADSAATKRQVLAHNATWRALCEKPKQ